MITRIRVKGYKSLADVELDGLSRLVVLFGPNAAGKSNLLDALDLLAHLAREDTLIAAFHRHRGNRAERPLPVRWFFHGLDEDGNGPGAGTDPFELEFEVDLDLQALVVEQLNRELEERESRAALDRPYTRVTRTLLRYALKLRYVPKDRSLDITHESLVPLSKGGQPIDSVIPYVKHEPGARRLSVKLERQAHPRYYELPRSRTLLSEIGDAVNHPHLVAAARELRSIRVYYVEPLRMRSAVADVEATDPGPHGEQLATFYHWLKRKHGVSFRNLLHNLGRIVPGLSSLDVREGAEGFLELWVSEGDGAQFPAALVSEGTLRLLCLLGIAATPRRPAIVGYEEPENGVNPGRLGELLEILENASQSPPDTQLILTTHSPEVVDFFEAATRIRCERGGKGSIFTPSEELPLFQEGLAHQALGSVPRATLGERLARSDLG
jgi:predicted ATPase